MHLYLDGELPMSEVPELMEHLEKCESCRKLFEELREVSFTMREMPVEIPEDLHGRIMGSVERRRRQTAFRKITRIFSAAAACAALLLVVIGGKLMMDGKLMPMKAESAAYVAEDDLSVSANGAGTNVRAESAQAAASLTTTRAATTAATAITAPQTTQAAVLTTTAMANYSSEVKHPQDEEKKTEQRQDIPVPAGFTAEGLDFFVAASGTEELPEIFAGADIAKYPSLELEVYFFGDASGEEIAAALGDAGFMLHHDLDLGAPENGTGRGAVLIFGRN